MPATWIACSIVSMRRWIAPQPGGGGAGDGRLACPGQTGEDDQQPGGQGTGHEPSSVRTLPAGSRKWASVPPQTWRSGGVSKGTPRLPSDQYA